MIQEKERNGFIKLIILFIVTVALLVYFNVDIKAIVTSEPVQAVWRFSKTVFVNYLQPAAEYIWENILRDFIFENVTDFFNKADDAIKDKTIEDLIDTGKATTSTAT